MTTGSASLATSSARLITGPLMSRSLHMRRPTTLAGDLALFIWVHRSEPASPAFSFRYHCDYPFFAKLNRYSLGSSGWSKLGAQNGLGHRSLIAPCLPRHLPNPRDSTPDRRTRQGSLLYEKLRTPHETPMTHTFRATIWSEVSVPWQQGPGGTFPCTLRAPIALSSVEPCPRSSRRPSLSPGCSGHRATLPTSFRQLPRSLAWRPCSPAPVLISLPSAWLSP